MMSQTNNTDIHTVDDGVDTIDLNVNNPAVQNADTGENASGTDGDKSAVSAAVTVSGAAAANNAARVVEIGRAHV